MKHRPCWIALRATCSGATIEKHGATRWQLETRRVKHLAFRDLSRAAFTTAPVRFRRAVLMPELHARRCLVSGKVQGVFFRASTRQKAVELGCGGYAKNLADGRVEVLAIGEPFAVAQLIAWLRIGPPAAH